jgi:radical SAM protein
MTTRSPPSGNRPPVPVDTDKRPFVLVWEVTQACDLACDHCRAEARPHRHPGELTTEEGTRLLEEARRFGEGQLVVLSGGDPMVREDLTRLVEYGTELGLRMTLTPSGTEALTAERVEELADAGLQRMALSIDGPEAVHDLFRGEAGSYESTLDAAKAAQAAELPLQINTTVCASTVETLPAVRDVVSDLGGVLWSVFFLVPVGRGRRLEAVTPTQAESVLEWLDVVSDEADFGVKTTEAPHYRRVSLQRERDSAETSGGTNGGLDAPTGIVAGDGFAFVSHLGEVFPSGFLPKSAGNVREEGLVSTYRNAPLFEGLRDRDRLTGKCGACSYRHVCGGSRSRAFATTGDPFASDPLCAYVPEGYDGPLPDVKDTESTSDRSEGGSLL